MLIIFLEKISLLNDDETKISQDDERKVLKQGGAKLRLNFRSFTNDIYRVVEMVTHDSISTDF